MQEQDRAWVPTLFVTDPWGPVCGRQETHENGASPSGACPQISAGQSSELQKEPR